MTTRTDSDIAQDAQVPHLRSERDRAARYLDLWERNVGFAAAQGAAPGPPLSLAARRKHWEQ